MQETVTPESNINWRTYDRTIQQQPPDWLLETPCPGETLTFAFVLLVAMLLPIRSLIWRAIVRKACSTLLAFLADVSRNGIPRLSANSCAARQQFWHRGGGGNDSAAAKHVIRRHVGGTHLCDRVLDHLLIRHIALVAYEQLVDAFGSVSVNLLQPLLNVVEAVHVGDIVDDADAMGTAVVGRRDCPEPFLAGGIPL